MIQVRPIVQGDEIEWVWALKDISFEIESGDRASLAAMAPFNRRHC